MYTDFATSKKSMVPTSAGVRRIAWSHFVGTGRTFAAQSPPHQGAHKTKNNRPPTDVRLLWFSFHGLKKQSNTTHLHTTYNISKLRSQFSSFRSQFSSWPLGRIGCSQGRLLLRFLGRLQGRQARLVLHQGRPDLPHRPIAVALGVHEFAHLLSEN